MADYTNNLHVLADIVDPITLTIPVYPVKDAYLSQEEPVTPHGSLRYLIANNSTDEDYLGNKIIMAFDVPKLTEPQYENLIAVNLVLTSTSQVKRNATLGLKYHEDNGWIEDGTTYLGMPKDDDNFFMTQSIRPSDKTISFDITDIFKSHNNNEFHFPITILETNTNKTESKLQFGSREAGIKYSPVINISYAYFAENIDTMNLNGQMIIRRNVPDANHPAPELPGQLEIWGGTYRHHIDGQVNIRSWNVPDLNDDPPRPAPDLEGTATIRRTNNSFLEGQLVVRQNKESNLNGTVDVNVYITRRGYPEEDDPPARLPSDGRWVQPLKTPDLKGQVSINGWDVPGPNNEPPAPDLEGTIIIQKIKDEYLNGTVSINNNDAINDIDSTVIINKYFADDGTDDPQDPGKIHKPSHNIDSKIIVNEYFADDGTDDPNQPGIIHKQSGKLDGQVSINSWNVPGPDNEPPAPDFEGTINIRRSEDADLNSTVTINEYIADDGTDDPQKPDKFHKPSHNIEGQLIIREDAYINGTVTIHEYFVPDENHPAPDLEGTVIVRTVETIDIEGTLNIPKKDDIEGTVTIVKRYVKDVEGIIDIDTGSNGSYAFIIM